MLMRIAIAGAGMSGAFLYNLLKEAGMVEVDIFDKQRRSRCGIRPCAWGFAPSSEYRRLVSRVLDPGQFEMYHSDFMHIDGVKIPADIITFDKSALLRGLLEGVDVKYVPLDPTKYDRVIDATGVDRAFLGPIENNDLIADLIQYRVKSEEPLDPYFRTSTLGYEYCFPLGSNQYHVGKGSIKIDVSDFKPFGDENSKVSVVCKCPSRLRLASPYYSQPFVLNSKIVGMGESIGTVAPLGGDGNPYSMQCAEMLVENWDDLDAYTKAILGRFDWMRKERQAIEKLWSGKMPSMNDARAFIQHSRLAGFKMGPMYAMKLFRRSMK